MFKHYLTTVTRIVLRYKLYSLVNISGLAVGLCACVLIFLFVRFEMSYEDWLPNGDNIYRMDVAEFERDKSGALDSYASVSMGPLKAALEKDFPEIREVTRFLPGYGIVMRRGTEVFRERLSLVDPNFFRVFDLPFVAGSSESVLVEADSVILFEKAAQKYFGTTDPIGQNISSTSGAIYPIVGVLADLPQNTNLASNAGILIGPTSQSLFQKYFTHWELTGLETYFTLKPNNSIEQVEKRLEGFLNQNMPWEDTDTKPSDAYEFFPLAMTDTHLRGTYNNGFTAGEGMRIIQTFSMIGLLIFGIAVFNFVNSSTAIAGQRAREVALRKVVGARRDQLITQFVGETIGMVVIASALALILAELAMPWFRTITDRPIVIDYAKEPMLLIGLIIIIPIIGLIAGWYPAFYLSRFRPGGALHSNQPGASGPARTRMILILGQFTISIGLAIAATVVYMQFHYANNVDLGFNKENKLLLQGIGSRYVEDKIETLKYELGRLPGINGSTMYYTAPGDASLIRLPVSVPHLDDTSMEIRINLVDHNYFDVFGVGLISGRFLSEEYSSDTLISPADLKDGENPSASVIVNRAATSYLGVGSPAEAVGETFQLASTDSDSGVYNNMTIVGVVEDFMERSIRSEVEPTVYYVYPSWFSKLALSLEPESMPAILDEIDRVWKRVLPDQPIRRTFLDTQLEGLYQSTRMQSTILLTFSLLAIMISSLGLFGLAVFSAERRNKEVGIRKVHGAKVADVLKLFAWQFTKPILIANLVAWPVAWYFLQGWLTEFAYRIDLTLWPFIGAGLAAFLVANGTVVIHAARVARTNPVLVLKHE